MVFDLTSQLNYGRLLTYKPQRFLLVLIIISCDRI